MRTVLSMWSKSSRPLIEKLKFNGKIALLANEHELKMLWSLIKEQLVIRIRSSLLMNYFQKKDTKRTFIILEKIEKKFWCLIIALEYVYIRSLKKFH